MRVSSPGREMMAMLVFGWRLATSSIACAVATMPSSFAPFAPSVSMQGCPSMAFASASKPFFFSSSVRRSIASLDWHQITPGQPLRDT